MTPTPLHDLRAHIERVQALADPAERERALAVIERELRDLLGSVQTFRGDTRLQLEGAGSGSNGDPPEGSDPA